MNRINVEVCVDCATREAVRRSVRAAYEGGAATVELCSDMAAEGLTPAAAHVAEARAAFRDRPGVMVMIRPRAGGFSYTGEEIERMRAQIAAAHAAGADGVVLGVLRPGDGTLDVDALRRLLPEARARGLAVTFHRAFDAVPDPGAALETLVALGVDRVLTSGTPWGSGGSLAEGADRVRALVAQAGTRIEIVASGGVRPATITPILRRLGPEQGLVSVHAYSGVLEGGVADRARVAALVRAVALPA